MYTAEWKWKTELTAILSAKDASATDKALEAFTWGTRGLFFWDGNKRASLVLANKILISSGAGILTITDKFMEEFNIKQARILPPLQVVRWIAKYFSEMKKNTCFVFRNVV